MACSIKMFGNYLSYNDQYHTLSTRPQHLDKRHDQQYDIYKEIK